MADQTISLARRRYHNYDWAGRSRTADGYNCSLFSDAGTVELKGVRLPKQSNNSYTFTPSLTNPTGIDLSGDITWNVSGNGDVPAFHHMPLPQHSPALVAIAAVPTYLQIRLHLTVASVNNADSVYFQVGSVVKFFPEMQCVPVFCR